MKQSFVIACAATIVLTGCATWIKANRECADPSWQFADTVACINKVTDGSRNRYDVSYRLAANSLMDQVKTGKISETDAKMKLQDRYMSLQRDLNSDGGTFCTAAGKTSMMCF